MNTIPLDRKTNEIVNKLLLAGYKFMPEMYLKQPGFTYRACKTFTKNKERIKRFKEAVTTVTTVTSSIYKNELDKACFQYNMANGNLRFSEKSSF